MITLGWRVASVRKKQIADLTHLVVSPHQCVLWYTRPCVLHILTFRYERMHTYTSNRSTPEATFLYPSETSTLDLHFSVKENQRLVFLDFSE